MKRKTAYLGLFSAVAIILGYVESLIPVFAGIPGIKLGLANLAVLFILDRYSAKAVSYTHLDVYKRQAVYCCDLCIAALICYRGYSGQCCFYSGCFSFVNNCRFLCEFYRWSFYSYFAGCCCEMCIRDRGINHCCICIAILLYFVS